MATANAYGSITIVDTNDIESITIEYARNQDSQTAPTSGWDTTRPDWAQGYYIWQRTRIHKSGTQASTDTFGAAVCLTGSTGAIGSAGRSLTNTVTQYTTAAANVTITESNMGSYTWSSNVPTYNSSTPAYWVRVTNTYSNPSSTEYIIYKDNGITDAMSTAAAANATANRADTNASNALSIANGTAQHFWTIATDYSTDIPAGSYITDTAIDTFKSQKTGGNLLSRSDGLWIRNGIYPLASLTGSALSFYRPGTTTIDAQLNSNGLILSKGGIRAGTASQSGFVYLSTDPYGAYNINDSAGITDWKQIIGTKFGVTADGTLYASGANISGTITATSESNIYTKDETDALLEDIFELDIKYTWGATSVLLEALLLKNGRDIHTQYTSSQFIWQRETQNGVINIGSGYTKVVSRSDITYNGAIMLSLFTGEPMAPVLPNDTHIILPDNQRLLLTV